MRRKSEPCFKNTSPAVCDTLMPAPSAAHVPHHTTHSSRHTTRVQHLLEGPSSIACWTTRKPSCHCSTARCDAAVCCAPQRIVQHSTAHHSATQFQHSARRFPSTAPAARVCCARTTGDNGTGCCVLLELWQNNKEQTQSRIMHTSSAVDRASKNTCSLVSVAVVVGTKSQQCVTTNLFSGKLENSREWSFLGDLQSDELWLFDDSHQALSV